MSWFSYRVAVDSFAELGNWFTASSSYKETSSFFSFRVVGALSSPPTVVHAASRTQLKVTPDDFCERKSANRKNTTDLGNLIKAICSRIREPINRGAVELTAAKIREMMASAQRTIAERKVQLGLGEGKSANGLNVPSGTIPDTETFDKLRRAAQLQAQIAARMNSGILSKYAVSAETETNALTYGFRKSKDIPNVIFDEEGKTIDATTGEEIQLTHYTPTLKANLRAQRAQQFKEVLQTTTQKKPQKNLTATAYFDPRLRYSCTNF
ncbi:hypothetical protein T265_08739 [Opisthorchis viverrini]|uniref:Uncharacterized protein n=1 Tax=Opisthorchis viverrini TaxID=6198 RepID=A0A074ZJ38_OPIVI|nr:hypothetical protein T265_08739 [Opisthorchis viverrini]KER23365.1 hypothetical protein T265_08739 [Opisthorchis viverrini]